jgi:hypothetical protein
MPLNWTSNALDADIHQSLAQPRPGQLHIQWFLQYYLLGYVTHQKEISFLSRSISWFLARCLTRLFLFCLLQDFSGIKKYLTGIPSAGKFISQRIVN